MLGSCKAWASYWWWNILVYRRSWRSNVLWLCQVHPGHAFQQSGDPHLYHQPGKEINAGKLTRQQSRQHRPGSHPHFQTAMIRRERDTRIGKGEQGKNNIIHHSMQTVFQWLQGRYDTCNDSNFICRLFRKFRLIGLYYYLPNGLQQWAFVYLIFGLFVPILISIILNKICHIAQKHIVKFCNK